MANDNYGEDRGARPADREEPEERTDGWMTTYADMVTLLLTFFVLLFAISNVDNEKAMLLFAGFSREGLSLERFVEIQEMFADYDGEDIGDYPVAPDEAEEPPDDAAHQHLVEMYEAISEYIERHSLGHSIAIELDGDFLVVTLPGDIAFASAEATITPQMREIAAELANLIAAQHTVQYPFEIIVTGHTDNVPINSALFQSNWRLSAVRAMNFLEVLIEESELEPHFFSSRGYGEYHPVADNTTSEGRQKNRRVEVMITPLRQTEDGRIRLG